MKHSDIFGYWDICRKPNTMFNPNNIYFMANNTSFKAQLEDLQKELWLRMRNEGRIYWVTKDKKRIPIKDMDTEHLINTIMMLTNQRDRMYEQQDHIGDMDPLDYYD